MTNKHAKLITSLTILTALTLTGCAKTKETARPNTAPTKTTFKQHSLMPSTVAYNQQKKANDKVKILNTAYNKQDIASLYQINKMHPTTLNSMVLNLAILHDHDFDYRMSRTTQENNDNKNIVIHADKRMKTDVQNFSLKNKTNYQTYKRLDPKIKQGIQKYIAKTTRVGLVKDYSK